MEQPQQAPRTLVEVLFDIVDSVARRIVELMPLGRGIRNAMSSTTRSLISWDHVREIAVATLQLQREKPEPISQHIIDQYQNMLEAAKKNVADYTGLEAVGLPDDVKVFDQADWIDANIVSFKFLFDPISEKYVETMEELGSGSGMNRFAHTLLTVQVGIIMGYMSRNVLGQFDLSLPEPEKGGKLYLVEPNVRRIEIQMNLHPREFRQWITLHEVTHSFEFHCNNWLRGYLLESMQQYLKTINWRGLSRPEFLKNLRKSEIRKDDAMRAGGLISMVSTPEQMEILKRLQAIMSVLEGYSNHVMDQVGNELLATYSTMKERFEKRREMKSGAERLFQRLIGIELKLQQYKIGQIFVDRVVEEEGMGFLNRVWDRPENMPDMEEINDADRWIARIKDDQS